MDMSPYSGPIGRVIDIRQQLYHDDRARFYHHNREEFDPDFPPVGYTHTPQCIGNLAQRGIPVPIRTHLLMCKVYTYSNLDNYVFKIIVCYIVLYLRGIVGFQREKKRIREKFLMIRSFYCVLISFSLIVLDYDSY